MKRSPTARIFSPIRIARVFQIHPYHKLPITFWIRRPCRHPLCSIHTPRIIKWIKWGLRNVGSEFIFECNWPISGSRNGIIGTCCYRRRKCSVRIIVKLNGQFQLAHIRLSARAELTDVKTMLDKSPMIEMTTKSSIRVNPFDV